MSIIVLCRILETAICTIPTPRAWLLTSLRTCASTTVQDGVNTLTELVIGTKVDPPAQDVLIYKRSLPLRLFSCRRSQPTEQGQNHHSQQEETQPATGKISPAGAVRPKRKYGKKHNSHYDDQNSIHLHLPLLAHSPHTRSSVAMHAGVTLSSHQTVGRAPHAWPYDQSRSPRSGQTSSPG